MSRRSEPLQTVMDLEAKTVKKLQGKLQPPSWGFFNSRHAATGLPKTS